MIREFIQIVYWHALQLLAVLLVLSLVAVVLESIALAFLTPLMAVLTQVPADTLRWAPNLVAEQFDWAGSQASVLVFAGIPESLMIMWFAVIARIPCAPTLHILTRK